MSAYRILVDVDNGAASARVMQDGRWSAHPIYEADPLPTEAREALFDWLGIEADDAPMFVPGAEAAR